MPLSLLLAVAVVGQPDPGLTARARSVLATCVRCHGPAKQLGGLRLDRRADVLRGGDSGPAVAPGKPADSLLLKKVTAHDEAERMPPDGDPLPAEQVRALKDWIAAGAAWPTADQQAAPTHWAFRPLAKPLAGASIDGFIDSKLNAVGLTANPPADHRTLIRRLKFDLLGLPPTPEEVEAFVNDRSPDAYEKLVDRYLASPHFGERWARHWLDVVRFAESHGFEMNQPRPAAWPYRDWVIGAFNADLPFDRFVTAQLAGDTLGADAATGFLVAGPWDQVKSPDPVLTRQQRADELHDMVSTAGSAFLGLTVGCARCHAHKFDPVPQADYYRLTAVFAGVQHGERAVSPADPDGRKRQIAAARAELATIEAKLDDAQPLADPAATDPRREPVGPRRNVERFTPVTAKFVRFVVLGTNNLEPCLDELEVFTACPGRTNVALASAGATVTSAGDYTASPDIHRLAFLIDGQYGNGRSWISNRPGRGRVTVALREPAVIDRVVWGRDREGKFTDRLATRYRIDVSSDGEAWQVVASSDDRHPPGSKAVPPPKELTAAREKLATLERADLVYAGRFVTPEPTFRLHRGDPMAPREPVGPGVLSDIGPKLVIPPGATDAERRQAFARWVVDPANPLTPRVIVNRLWQHHFGPGLVDTPSDFGRNGGTPSHPELLDYLAGELIARKWSLKAVHRLIVTSAAYRRSSAASPALAADAQSRLLWRYPPRRLEAEAIRDAVLAVSGKLDLRAGGPGFDLFEPNTNYVKVYTPKTTFGPAEFRRMVYQQKPRMQVDDTFGAFDCPDGGQIAPKRSASTTPLQALNLLNSPFLVQQAGFLADRAKAEAGPEVADQVGRVFALAFQRPPTAAERDAAVKLAAKYGLAAVCRAVLNANEFLYVD
ncbi:MAG: PSD1 and planctomycete cytochrome C domain-containing protein [Gemmataceae bacterium]